MTGSMERIRRALDTLVGNRAISIAFVLQIFSAIGIYYISYIVGWNRYEHSDVLSPEVYPLFLFSTLIVIGIFSILSMLVVGSITKSAFSGDDTPVGKHISRSIHALPGATVAFLFPWMLSFGVPVVFMILVGHEDEMCFILTFYYILVWFVIAFTFFSPFIILEKGSIKKSLTGSRHLVSANIGDVAFLTAALSALAYVSLFFAIDLGNDPLTPIFLLIFSLLMTYTYVFLAVTFFSIPSRDSPDRNQQYQSSTHTMESSPILLLGFTGDEVRKLREKGLTVTPLSALSRSHTLREISHKPEMYSGDSTWSPVKLAIFSSEHPFSTDPTKDVIRNVCGNNVVFHTITPYNSGHILDNLIVNILRKGS